MISKRRAARRSLAVPAACLLALSASQALAQSAEPRPVPPVPAAGGPAPAPPTAEERQAEVKAAWAAALEASTRGPAKVGLRDQADLDLPQGEAFIPEAEGARVLRAYGNVVGENLVGVVAGTSRADDWLVVIKFVADGYIKDDDAKDWNADDLLQSLKDGTAAANADRVSRGFPQIEILGWVEPPAYDAQTHRLVWSLASKREDEPEDAGRGVNYNTYALGRDGYMSLNLLTSTGEVAAQKPIAGALLSALAYRPGKRYADFESGTDRIAAYGLAALVGGVAVKKLGLFALAAAFALKFAKVGLLALAGLWAAFARFFRRRPKTPQVSSSVPQAPSPVAQASSPVPQAPSPVPSVSPGPGRDGA